MDERVGPSDETAETGERRRPVGRVVLTGGPRRPRSSPRAVWSGARWYVDGHDDEGSSVATHDSA